MSFERGQKWSAGAWAKIHPWSRSPTESLYLTHSLFVGVSNCPNLFQNAAISHFISASREGLTTPLQEATLAGNIPLQHTLVPMVIDFLKTDGKKNMMDMVWSWVLNMNGAIFTEIVFYLHQ